MATEERIEQKPYDRWGEDNVVDANAYKRWQAMLRNRLLGEGRFIAASDGSIINLGVLPHAFIEKIAHLPDEEREEFVLKQREYQRIMGKANVEKKKAFGLINRSPAQQKLGMEIDVLEERGQEIRELYGRMFSPEEVQSICVTEFKIPCSIEAAVAFRAKHLDQITKRIEAFKRDYSDLRLVAKRGRIEELAWMYMRVKNRYVSVEGNSDREFLLKLLEQLRKESEGDVIKVEGNLDVRIESLVNVHLRQEILGQINLTQIIIGRVASRVGRPPEVLIKRLADSFYAKFNGMLGDVQDAEYEELKYPSAEGYDFDSIRSQYKINTREEAQEIAQEGARAKEIAVATEGKFKDVMLKKLAQMRGDNSAKSAVLDQHVLDRKLKEAQDKAKVKLTKK